MGEFQEIAERIAGILAEMTDKGGVTSQQLAEIVGSALREGGSITGSEDSFNCYPGIPGHGCKELAFFLSLSSSSFSKGRGHLNCKQAMENIIQHMQGSCPGITRYAIFLTDSWDAYAFNEWQANLRQIKQKALLEVYLLTGKNVSYISLSR